jgi:multiple sugar transport system permease protein
MQELVRLTRKPRVRRRPQGPTAKREEREFYLFIAPWLTGFVVFYLGPIVASFFISFTEWPMLRSATWIGLANYVKLMGEDELFWKALFNTVYYVTFSVPLQIISGFCLAILLNQKVKGMPLFRTLFYIPSLITGVSIAVIWSWLLNPQFGLVNHALALVGIEGPDWLFNTKSAMPAMVLMSLWGVGGGMVIYLAGLQGIPEHLYEAAEIDGAGLLAKFRHVTIPMMTPTIFFNLIMGIIGAFQTFAQFFIMTNGGPADATLTMVLYLYRNAFEYFKMGYASSLAWILFLILIALTLIQFGMAKLWVYYETPADRS